MIPIPDQVKFACRDGECSLTRTYAYHRHLPEIQDEGESPEVAVKQLAYRLACAHLALEQALADVCGFIAAGRDAL